MSGPAANSEDMVPHTELALLFAKEAYEACFRDPGASFVVLMTAAAVAGHAIDRDMEEMHQVLDKVNAPALAAFLKATKTKQ